MEYDATLLQPEEATQRSTEGQIRGILNGFRVDYPTPTDHQTRQTLLAADITTILSDLTHQRPNNPTGTPEENNDSKQTCLSLLDSLDYSQATLENQQRLCALIALVLSRYEEILQIPDLDEQTDEFHELSNLLEDYSVRLRGELSNRSEYYTI